MTPLPEVPDRAEEVGLNLALLWALVRKHLRQILGYSLALGVLVGLLSLFVLPKKYEARAVLLPPAEDLLSGGGWIKSLVPGLTGGGTSAEVMMALLQSDRVCWSVIQNLRLDTLWEDTVRQELLKRAQDRLKVESDITLGTILVKFRERDPRLAARVVEEILRVTEQLNDTLKISPIKPFLRVLDPPYPPHKKASPKTTLNVLVTLFLAGVLLTGFFGLREVRKARIDDCWDLRLAVGDRPCQSYRSPEDLKHLRYPALRAAASGKPGVLAWFPGTPKGLLDTLLQQLNALASSEAAGWSSAGPLPEALPQLLSGLAPDQEFWILVPAGRTTKEDLKALLSLLRRAGREPTLFLVLTA